MKRRDRSREQEAALLPLVESMNQAIADEALLRRIYTAMGPYAFNGTPTHPKEWEECLRAMRDRFGFDDSE